MYRSQGTSLSTLILSLISREGSTQYLEPKGIRYVSLSTMRAVRFCYDID